MVACGSGGGCGLWVAGVLGLLTVLQNPWMIDVFFFFFGQWGVLFYCGKYIILLC